MNALRNIFPYGLNEWARKHDSKVPVGKLFFSIPRTKQGSARYRNNNDHLKNNTFLQTLMKSFKTTWENSLYKIHITLNNLTNCAKENT